MKNPTYAQFMNEIESIISNLSQDELKNKIMHLAESQGISDRNNFLQLLKRGISPLLYSDKEKAISEISPKKLIERIEKFNQRILNGEFFDEEENMVAYHKEEHRYGRNRYNDYCEDEIDFSNEPYVLEAIELLEEAKMLFRRDDIETAYKAYGMLFDIFENPDYRNFFAKLTSNRLHNYF